MVTSSDGTELGPLRSDNLHLWLVNDDLVHRPRKGVVTEQHLGLLGLQGESNLLPYLHSALLCISLLPAHSVFISQSFYGVVIGRE
jgi:hypothetical protein